MNEFTLSELKETYTEEYEVWNTDVSLQRVIAFFKSILPSILLLMFTKVSWRSFWRTIQDMGITYQKIYEDFCVFIIIFVLLSFNSASKKISVYTFCEFLKQSYKILIMFHVFHSDYLKYDCTIFRGNYWLTNTSTTSTNSWYLCFSCSSKYHRIRRLSRSSQPPPLWTISTNDNSGCCTVEIYIIMM